MTCCLGTWATPDWQIVFPPQGFVFGRTSTPWVQVLVKDDAQEAVGVREVSIVSCWSMAIGLLGLHGDMLMAEVVA
jgi:hypothetical protein